MKKLLFLSSLVLSHVAWSTAVTHDAESETSSEASFITASSASNIRPRLNMQRPPEEEIRLLKVEMSRRSDRIREILDRTPNMRSCIILVGKTGVGKSTLINLMAGSSLSATNTRRWNFDNPIEGIIPSNGTGSTTSQIAFSAPDREGNVYVDTPGLEDNRGAAERINHAYELSILLKGIKAKQTPCKFVFCVDQGDFQARDLFTEHLKNFISQLSFESGVFPFGLILTHSDPIDLEDNDLAWSNDTRDFLRQKLRDHFGRIQRNRSEGEVFASIGNCHAYFPKRAQNIRDEDIRTRIHAMLARIQGTHCHHAGMAIGAEDELFTGDLLKSISEGLAGELDHLFTRINFSSNTNWAGYKSNLQPLETWLRTGQQQGDLLVMLAPFSSLVSGGWPVSIGAQWEMLSFLRRIVPTAMWKEKLSDILTKPISALRHKLETSELADKASKAELGAAAANQRAANAETAANQARQDASRANERASNAESRIANAEANANAANQRASGLSTTIAGLNSTLSGLNATVGRLEADQKRRSQLNREVDELDVLIRNLGSPIHWPHHASFDEYCRYASAQPGAKSYADIKAANQYSPDVARRFLQGKLSEKEAERRRM